MCAVAEVGWSGFSNPMSPKNETRGTQSLVDGQIRATRRLKKTGYFRLHLRHGWLAVFRGCSGWGSTDTRCRAPFVSTTAAITGSTFRK